MTATRNRKEGYAYAHGERFDIEVTYTQEHGHLRKFVVGLFAKVGRSRLMVARFDNEHGFIHMDMVTADGRLIAKVPFANLSTKDAIQYAKRYFESNAPLLHDQFLRRSQASGRPAKRIV